MSKAAEARRQQARKEKEYENLLREQFRKVQRTGIAAGASAMCKVILEKAKAEGKTDSERLQEIIDFCMTTGGQAAQSMSDGIEEIKGEEQKENSNEV